MSYPPIIEEAHFPQPPPVEIVNACPANEARKCGIESLTLQGHPSAGSGYTHGHGPLDPQAAERFVFAPRVESFQVKWRFHGHAHIRKVKLELFRRNQALPFWSKTLEWEGARAQEGTTPFDGDLASNAHPQVVPDGAVQVTYNHQGSFPRDVLTVEHAPYKLQLRIVEVEEDTQVVDPARWIYLDVLVHDIKLELGPQAWVPPLAPANYVQTRRQTLRREVHQRVAQQLQGNNPAPLALTDPGAPAELRLSLKSHVFAKSVRDFYRNTVFAEMRELWGNGPPLPLVATLRVQQSNGQPAPLQQGAVALGGVRLLWDWLNDQGSAVDPTTHDVARSFIQEALLYRPQEWPHARPNSHVEHGGKRGLLNGAAEPYFEDVPGLAPATPVTAAVQRPWAAFTPVIDDPNAANAGTASVLFLPSRIAGDRFRPRLFLAYPNTAALDVADLQAQGAAAGTCSATSTSIFTVWRRVHVARHWRKHAHVDAASMNWATVARYFEPAFIEVVAPPNGVEDINALHYENAVDQVRNRIPVAIKSALADSNQQHNGDHAITYLNWAGFKQQIRAYLQAIQQFVRAAAPATDQDVLQEQIPYMAGNQRYHEDLFIENLKTLNINDLDKLVTQVLRDAGIRDESAYKEKLAQWGDETIAKICGRLARDTTPGEDGIHFFQFEFNDNLLNQTEVAEAATTIANQVNCPQCNAALPANAPPRYWSDAASDANRICAACQHRLHESCTVITYVPHRYMNGQSDAFAKQNLGWMQRVKIRAGRKYGTTADISIAHEVGHQLGLPHAGPNAAMMGITVMKTGGIEPAYHDVDDPACLMSYNFTLAPQLHFCGLCNLRLRGWSMGPSNVALAFENARDASTVVLHNQRQQNQVP
ncbi:hypothetical protein [Archangium lansingense]|uniref:Peptidase M10 metallopeptidase domain-containing protein n=1 Tax=Archangium lansingense TaxID=2995310 RepID=A0ABT4ANZ0_9BACT|nr:hypothetical protein [Archangium lansinium]MCY1083405.1 hypothetical protein [Archangium lansinium]